MKVLTLTTKEQLDEYSRYSYKLLREGNYDKVIFKGITGIIGYVIVSVINQASAEIEIQNCTIEGFIDIISIKTPLKITIKDSTIQELHIQDISSISLVMDNVTGRVVYIIGNSDIDGKSSVTIKNSMLFISRLDVNVHNIELSNNHDTTAYYLPVKCIPDDVTKQSTFLSQFIDVQTVVMPSKIDESNYQFDQVDWDKLILLLDKYPRLFKIIKFDDSFINIINASANNIYLHIPSLTFPYRWLNILNTYSKLANSNASLFANDSVLIYVNKNNGYNFTVTGFDHSAIGFGSMLGGFLIADNYKDLYVGSSSINAQTTFLCQEPLITILNVLSGKMVTSEITLMPNTYFIIRTLDKDMKIKRIKEVTGFRGKTIKVTGMEPFMLVSVAGTKCRDIDGMIEVNRTGSEAFIDGSIAVKLLSMVDIDGNIIIQQKTYTNITGKVTVNQIESDINGDVSIKAIQESIIGGTIPVEVPNQEVDIDGVIIVAGIEKFITGIVNVRPIVSAAITGKIAINCIDYELDGSFQLTQAVSTDIIGDIEVRVCRIEILGFFDFPMEEVWG